MRPRPGHRWSLPLTLALATLLAGAGCSDRSRLSPPDALAKPEALAPSARCDANRVANAVGRRPTPELVEAARVGAGASRVRTLAHDAPVSSGHRAEQLNLVLDTEGRIGSVNCG